MCRSTHSPGPDHGAQKSDVSRAVIVRAADSEDAAALVGLLRVGSLGISGEYPGDPTPYRAALQEIEETKECEILVAELDGQVIGACQLIIFRYLQHRGGRCAEIESMHGTPDLWGTGIGALLLEATVDVARAAGCYRVQQASNAARCDAHRFYERHGFEGSLVGSERLLEGPA